MDALSWETKLNIQKEMLKMSSLTTFISHSEYGNNYKCIHTYEEYMYVHTYIHSAFLAMQKHKNCMSYQGLLGAI